MMIISPRRQIILNVYTPNNRDLNMSKTNRTEWRNTWTHNYSWGLHTPHSVTDWSSTENQDYGIAGLNNHHCW